MNGVKPSSGTVVAIEAIAPRPILFITTGTGGEQRIGRVFHQAASEPKDLWELPEAKHGGAYFAQAEAFTQRVGEFFDTVFMLDSRAGSSAHAEL
jgi:hypothetical protein